MKRLINKTDRLAVQKGQFDHMLKNGFDQITHKGLNFFVKDENGKYLLKAFKDTAAKSFQYCYYRSSEERQKAIDSYKAGYERHLNYKKECKENPTKSTAANCAQAIRTELKDCFPDIKFSITSSNFSMGNSVSIGWLDGPTDAQVTDIVSKYQYGQFDGMQDMYENTNVREDLPQTKYVSTSRKMSEQTKAILEPIAAKLFTHESENYSWGGNTLYRIFAKTPIPVNAKILGIERTDIMAGQSEDFYFINFERATENEAPVFEKQEVKTGEVNIIDYSVKAIAVIGDTKPIKDKLKELGGVFNFRLSCGPGWIFPKSKLDIIQTALTA